LYKKEMICVLYLIENSLRKIGYFELFPFE
jgi:hypothetical protein